mgnify:CR=1 FL=1
MRTALEGVPVSDGLVARLTERKGLTPAQIRTAVRFAQLAQGPRPTSRRRVAATPLDALIERQLRNADHALGRKPDPVQRPVVTQYSLDMLNVESRHPVARIIEALKARGHGCLCFHGAPGTGKTARAVVPVVHGLRSTLPDTGVLAVDSKGALWKPLAAMAEKLGQKESLRLIRVRPTHIAPAQWTPPLRLNILGDASVPWSTYAKIVVDTATASGQRGGQAFFKETARDAITHAMHALELAELPVTLANVHDTICISTETALLLARLAEHPSPAAEVERLIAAGHKRIGFLGNNTFVIGLDFVFVACAFINTGNKSFPNARAVPTHVELVFALDPVIKIAHDRNRTCGRCPNGKIHAFHTIDFR